MNTVFKEAVGISLADADTIKLPLILENTFTSKPLSGEIDAVALPLNIFVESIERFAKDIFLNWEPSPTK